ncbi:hypothetical protein [Brevibacillus gelatini]|uniref:Uncharacterized protein n=1 Tax=Brevibacillus gelatini TaxID=1655277 RepID=A0A3M8AZZ9_9BACL|nr:hypothetical protein [Brevibacillus gelatini]RNB56786.1 hypothetical protein EDM57_10690 [Brevibacillus gelatini]
MLGKIVMAFTTSLVAGYVYLDNQVEVRNSHASVTVYESVKDLEKDADLIIIGEATNKTENYIRYHENGEIDDYSTKRMVKVQKIFKNNLDEKLAVGDEVEVWEPSIIIKDGVIGKQQRTIEGYRLMQNEKKYVLFLKKNTYFNNLAPLGVIQGKFPLDEASKSLNYAYKDEFKHYNFPQFDKLNEEVSIKYKME